MTPEQINQQLEQCADALRHRVMHNNNADLCDCSHQRDDHDDGTGRCTGDLMRCIHGCTEFTLRSTASHQLAVYIKRFLNGGGAGES